MGRGFSELQKRILVLALFNEGGEVRREHNFPVRPDLFARKVMVTLYKIEANFISAAEAWNPDPSPYVTMRTDYPVRDRRGWVLAVAFAPYVTMRTDYPVRDRRGWVLAVAFAD